MLEGIRKSLTANGKRTISLFKPLTLNVVNFRKTANGLLPTALKLRKVSTVPDRRRFGRVNVICVIIFACIGGKGEGKEGQWGLGTRPKSGAIDTEHGASKGTSSQLHSKSYHSK
jgi:hypothetical protein